MKNTIYFTALILIFSACGSDKDADQLCRDRFKKEEVINQCKESLQKICTSADISILRKCSEKVASKECKKSIGELTTKCHNERVLLESCLFGKEKATLKPNVTVDSCIESVKSSCTEDFDESSAKGCIKGEDCQDSSQMCSKKLDELLVNFIPAGGVKDSCITAQNSKRLLKGTAHDCFVALKDVCNSKKDMGQLKKCAEGIFCDSFFNAISFSVPCRQAAGAYVLGVK